MISEDYKRLRGGVGTLLHDLGEFLGDLVEGPQPAAANDEDDTVDSPRKVIDEQLHHFFGHYHALRRRHDEDALSVAVLALTKSGKSTLLNSLIGAECLPMNNVPETARICRIVHSPKKPAEAEAAIFLVEGQSRFEGERAVRTRLQELNTEARAHEQLAPDRSNFGVVLDLHAPVLALQEYDSFDVGKLQLLDTPGPNEAGEEGLRHQVERMLDTVDAVVYLLDYTKLKTQEEASMFKRLKQINPQLVRRLSQRLFFVVNKVDTVQTSDGLDLDETREYVASLVTRQLECDGFQLMPEQVILLSARNALLSRLVLSGKASDEVMRRFLRIAFGFAGTAAASSSRGSAGISFEAVVQAANALLADSGIMDLEQQVLTFLYAHSGAVKLLAMVDDISRLLQEVRNVAVSCQACLQQNVEDLKQQAQLLRGELQSTLNTFDEVMRDTDKVAMEVTAEIRAHLGTLRGRLFSHIIQTLDTEVVHNQVPASHAAAGSSRWQRLRDKFLSIFTSSPASGLGTAAARSRSRQELLMLLTDLHEDLLAQIHADVGDFWHILEACTNSRHAELVSKINVHLEKLSRQVEAAVAARLDVRLEPVDLSMRMPSAQQFHSDLQALINKGIVEVPEKHIRVGTRSYEERVLRRGEGICRWGQYWAVVPRTRTVVETYMVTMYELQPAEITAHFVQMVDSAIESTESVLSSYVTGFIHQQLEDARKQVQGYSERYLSAMTSSLEAGHRGAEHRMAALQQVEAHLQRLDALTTALRTLQTETELLVPCIQDAVPYDELDLLGDELEPGSPQPVPPAPVQLSFDSAEGTAGAAGAGAAGGSAVPALLIQSLPAPAAAGAVPAAPAALDQDAAGQPQQQPVAAAPATAGLADDIDAWMATNLSAVKTSAAADSASEHVVSPPSHVDDSPRAAEGSAVVGTPATAASPSAAACNMLLEAPLPQQPLSPAADAAVEAGDGGLTTADDVLPVEAGVPEKGSSGCSSPVYSLLDEDTSASTLADMSSCDMAHGALHSEEAAVGAASLDMHDAPAAVTEGHAGQAAGDMVDGSNGAAVQGPADAAMPAADAAAPALAAALSDLTSLLADSFVAPSELDDGLLFADMHLPTPDSSLFVEVPPVPAAPPAAATPAAAADANAAGHALPAPVAVAPPVVVADSAASATLPSDHLHGLGREAGLAGPSAADSPSPASGCVTPSCVAAGAGAGAASAVLESPIDDGINYEEVPFDYTHGFARAMSSCHTAVQAEAGIQSPADDSDGWLDHGWTVVDDLHNISAV